MLSKNRKPEQRRSVTETGSRASSTPPDQKEKEPMEKNMTEKEFLAAIQAEDTVPYGLANDYMFHAVLQSSEEALKGLLSALMYIPEAEILSCTVLK